MHHAFRILRLHIIHNSPPQVCKSANFQINSKLLNNELNLGKIIGDTHRYCRGIS